MKYLKQPAGPVLKTVAAILVILSMGFVVYELWTYGETLAEFDELLIKMEKTPSGR